MPFRIVRNDITKMNTEAIVNTANDHVSVGTGCDSAVYKAAGYDELLKYREDNIGFVAEGGAFITPGFKLKAKYIIHAVSPLYMGGDQGEEEKLRSCYRKSLRIAKENGIKSISFPLISTGGFGYPKEEGMRIAVDEINAFLLSNEMDIFLVVFDTKATQLGEKIYSGLEAYIDHNYVKEAREEEYGDAYFSSMRPSEPGYDRYLSNAQMVERRTRRNAEAQKREMSDFSVKSVPPVSAVPEAEKQSLTGSIFKKKKTKDIVLDEALSINECCDEAPFFDFEIKLSCGGCPNRFFWPNRNGVRRNSARPKDNPRASSNERGILRESCCRPSSSDVSAFSVFCRLPSKQYSRGKRIF